jgi:hypothetical protein
MSTREKILAWQAQINELKATRYKASLDREQVIATEITTLFKRIQNKDYADTTEYEALGARIDTLNEQAKALKREFLSAMQTEFNELYTTYPGIFDILVNNKVDQATLLHVLATFDRVEQGRLSADQGLGVGMNFLTDKYKLPDNFFNRPKGA